jgi:hypothetical protein
MPKEIPQVSVPRNPDHSMEIRAFSDIYERCVSVYGWPHDAATKAARMVRSVAAEVGSGDRGRD